MTDHSSCCGTTDHTKCCGPTDHTRCCGAGRVPEAKVDLALALAFGCGILYEGSVKYEWIVALFLVGLVFVFIGNKK